MYCRGTYSWVVKTSADPVESPSAHQQAEAISYANEQNCVCSLLTVTESYCRSSIGGSHVPGESEPEEKDRADKLANGRDEMVFHRTARLFALGVVTVSGTGGMGVWSCVVVFSVNLRVVGT